MTLLKQGIRFASQETDAPMIEEEVPYIVKSLTASGLRMAATAGISLLQSRGYSINQALELLGETPKEKSA